jgi:ADP-sugar diphosphatase
MYFYYCEITLPKDKIASFENKEMGTEYEFERISTHVYPFIEGHKLINNTNGLLLNYLYLNAVKDFELMSKLKI